ncbi:MAG: ABC transporter ATP-binding protein [Clostridiales bacterium]|nr:ABC transporter ATP-binding protein [Clostridiales bacterium]
MLEIRNLNIEFHDHLVPETVVHDLNLRVAEGEIVGLVGESGSGKTMTALAVAGLLRRHDMQKTGEILFQEKNLLECGRKELRELQGSEISMIFQEPMTSLNPVRRIGWQVEEALRLHTDLDQKKRKERALEVLSQVELPDVERVYRAYPHELSGGMRQRVMIAAAIICKPKLLIADEPTTALDVTIQAQIVKLLLKINRENQVAVLFISHDLSLVRQLCTRVAVMQNGYLVEEGRTESIFMEPKEAYTRQLIAAIPKIERVD